MWKSKKQKELGEVQLKAAQYIADSIITVQKKWAELMSRFMSRLTPGGQKIVLLAIGVVMFVSSAHLIYSGITTSNKTGTVSQSIPKLKSTPDLQLQNPVGGTNGAADRKKLLEYVDSLQKSGGENWELFNKRFPGLIDSLKALN